VSNKKIQNILRVFTLAELLKIFIQHILLRKLHQTNKLLFSFLSFVLASSSKGYSLSLLENNIVKIDFSVNQKLVTINIRKFSRDIYVFDQIFINNDYLPLVQKLQAKNLQSKISIIDAGANIGCASIFFLCYFPNSCLIAIEPENSNFELCTKNFNSNGYANNVQVIKSALWNTHSFLELQQRDTSHDGFHVMNKEVSDLIIDKVPTCTIQDLHKKLNTSVIDLFKIDIEGAEKVLIEDESTLNDMLSGTKVLALEVHEEFISEKYVSEVLKARNYQVVKSGEYLIAY